MGVRITANDGNGTIVEDSIFNYSYSEEVSAIEPSTITGGTGQVTFSAIGVDEDSSNLVYENSKLLINNNMTLVDDRYGTGGVSFQVKKLSKANGIVSITGDTVQSRLNVVKTAAAQGGSTVQVSLYEAIVYYCGLVGIVPNIDFALYAELDAIYVNFIAWTGNVWDHLKMLCAAVNINSSGNLNLEMYVDEFGLGFRKALQTIIDYTGMYADESISVDAFDAAKAVEVYNYNTSYGVNKVMYDIANYDENADPTTTFKSSIRDSIQVGAGETIKRRYNMDCTPAVVNQPVCVQTITRTPPAPYAGGSGEYVIVGSDNLPIMPAQWTSLGGIVTVALTENPGEIEITVTAPAETAIGTSLAPYKIGVESSGNADYPAFWITGSGVFFNKKKNTYLTGASDLITAKDVSVTVDNIFITNQATCDMRGIQVAQVACGPNISFNGTVVETPGFGQSIGTMQFIESNKFRTNSVAYSDSNATISGVSCATFADFDAIWTGKTFANFDTQVVTAAMNPTIAMKFNEFSVVPLMKAV